MQKIVDPPVQQCLPGERQWLRSALLADQDGILTATRLRLARIAQARGVESYVIDDVVQETLLEAWSHLDRLHSPAGFHFWVDEICRNICRRAARRRELDMLRHVPLLQPSAVTEDGEGIAETDRLVADVPDPLEELSRQDLVLLLDRALSVLSPATRQIVEMCYLLELPRSEVAARLSLSNSALDVRLHRARRDLRQMLHGPLRQDAEALGLVLDEALAEGWQQTRLWCPLCAHHRLEGFFLAREVEDGPNLHLRCPDCSRRYHQDTVHSMGLVQLSGLRSFRPAWKRTMQELSDRVTQALLQGQHPCLYCGKSANIQVKNGNTETDVSRSCLDMSSDLGDYQGKPYPFWVSLHCTHCGKNMDASGDIPSVDQLVYWSHPLTRHFLQQYPHWNSEPGKLVEYAGEPAIHFQIADVESSNCLTVLAHRQTLRVMMVS
ncbi:MAG: sigma-70 family RNA polymerase sigma factor [Ktedonobacteraceae bacterium]